MSSRPKISSGWPTIVELMATIPFSGTNRPYRSFPTSLPPTSHKTTRRNRAFMYTLCHFVRNYNQHSRRLRFYMPLD